MDNKEIMKTGNGLSCKECGYTESTACVTVHGPCGWHTPDLCTACASAPERLASLTFGHLSEMNGLRCATAFPECENWTPTDWGCSMAGEVGEACNKIKAFLRGDKTYWEKGKEYPLTEESIVKELADVVIYADLTARCLHQNLAAAIQKKFNEVSERKGAPFRL